MSTPTSKKIATKTNFAALLARRTRVVQETKADAHESRTGAPLWSEENLSPLNEEFMVLADRLSKIKFAGLRPPPEAGRILTRMREIRRTVKEEKEGLDHWQGRYVATIPPPGAKLTTAQVQLALAHADTYLAAPNPYMSLEHSYQTVGIPPDDWVLQTLQSNPTNERMVKDILRHVFVLPLLPNMLDRIDRGWVHQRQIPIWSTVARWWAPAMKEVCLQSVLAPMTALPNWMLTDVDEGASPGFPFSVMPNKENSSVPFSTVKDVMTFRTDDEARKDAPPTWFPAIMRHALRSILQPKALADDPFDERFWMYSVQAGNVKHVLRAEADKKPNRAIFSAPLVLRLVAGATAQPFYANWQNPQSLLGSSFEHGKTLALLARVFKCPPTISAVLTHVDLVPSKREGLLPELFELRVKDGFVAAPDKREFDLSTRPEPMEEFKKYSEGVLPTEASLPPDQAKQLAQWARIHRAAHDRDGKHKAVLTNHRVVIKMPFANPSGSMWTTTRNTWICIASEKAADQMAWHKVNPHREHEPWWYPCAYGDDVVGRLYGHSDEKLQQLWTAHMAAMRDIGWDYKPETVNLTKNLTDLEILGRNIFAYKVGDEVKGFVALRPRDKLWYTMVYPKEANRDMTLAAVRQARLIMLADECAFYPDQWQMAIEMFELGRKTFAANPKWTDKYYDPTFNVDYSKVSRPRAWAESMLLHLGVPVVAPIKREAHSSDEENEPADDADIDALMSVPAAAAKPVAVNKKKTALPVTVVSGEEPDVDEVVV